MAVQESEKRQFSWPKILGLGAGFAVTCFVLSSLLLGVRGGLVVGVLCLLPCTMAGLTLRTSPD